MKVELRDCGRLAGLYALLLLAVAGKELVLELLRALVPVLLGAGVVVVVGGVCGCPGCSAAMTTVRCCVGVLSVRQASGRRRRRRGR